MVRLANSYIFENVQTSFKSCVQWALSYCNEHISASVSGLKTEILIELNMHFAWSKLIALVTRALLNLNGHFDLVIASSITIGKQYHHSNTCDFVSFNLCELDTTQYTELPNMDTLFVSVHRMIIIISLGNYYFTHFKMWKIK